MTFRFWAPAAFSAAFILLTVVLTLTAFVVAPGEGAAHCQSSGLYSELAASGGIMSGMRMYFSFMDLAAAATVAICADVGIHVVCVCGEATANWIPNTFAPAKF